MKKLLPLTFLGAAAVGIAVLTGCQTPHDTGAYVPVNTMVNDVENHQLVVLMDPRVQYSVTCPNIQLTKTPDGRLEVTANIRNRENRRIELQVNCVFKDELGFPTEGDETPFRTLILGENAQEPVTFVAMNNKGQHYTIRIRQAH
jgi:uncharacterized protein YcfL